MRAVRLSGAKQLELLELPDPEPRDGEVLVRVAAAGICGSDLSCFKSGVFAGSVLGHEFSGFLADGTPVAIDPKMPCGACPDCRSGASYRCVEALTRGPGGMRDGGFAQLVAVPTDGVYALPSGLDVANACLAEPLAVAIHGIERAGVAATSATVVGLGPIGLLAVAALRSRGVAVAGVDPVGVRRDLAAAVGAERSFERIEDAPDGAPLILECSGRPELLQPATNLLAPGGTAVLLGVPMAEASVIPLVWVTRELRVIGSIASSPDDFAAALDLLAAEPAIARIITKRVSLDELPQAFEDLIHAPVDGKVVAVPG